MSVSIALQNQVLNHLSECIERASAFYNMPFHYDALEFKLRGQAAGQLRFKRETQTSFWSRSKTKKAISGAYFRFNAELLSNYEAAFIEEVVPHEVAHLVAYSVYGATIKPHGAEWKYVMREVLEREPNVRHKFEVNTPKRKTFSYACGCDDKVHQLSAIRHNRVCGARAVYKCRVCEHKLRSVA